ncbi:MAG: pentapeptide repeat-containing protein [Candidatus Hydrogenedentes bacterium]|nr:pentapeptide repeat-containing protein [Candidatus Hydrogenedentota bacterium]
MTNDPTKEATGNASALPPENKTHYEIIKTEGVEGWNNWRQAHKDVQPNLERADLSELNLTGINLSNGKLRGANFQKTFLVKAILCDADLRKCRFEEVEAREANLTNADLHGATLTGARLADANLTKTKFGKADFERVLLCGANLTRAELQEANFRNAFFIDSDQENEPKGLSYVNFTNAFLNKADFTDVELPNAILHNADLRGAILNGADLRYVQMEKALLNEKAEMTRALFLSANLQDCYFSNSTAEGANFQMTNLTGAHFDSANLKGADFQGSLLANADFQNAVLTDANLRSANVRGVMTNRNTKFRGIRLMDTHGSPRFVRFAGDQDYLEELSEFQPKFYKTWDWMAGCGRSPLRWATWSIFFALLFGCMYICWDQWTGSTAFTRQGGVPLQWWDFMYYSLANFTTLGSSDINPADRFAMALH